MEAYIYLIQNGDLYALGVSKNLEKTKQLLKPGQISAYMKSKDKESEILCRDLQNRYSEVRIPQTDYFRLSKSQLASRKKKWKAKKSSFGSGTLWKYAQTVGPAYLGAPTHPGKKKEVKDYSEI